MPTEISLFADATVKQPLDKIDFGRVMAGKKKSFIIFIKNIGKHPIEEFKVTSQLPQLKIAVSPNSILPPDVVTSMEIVWMPPLDSEEALNTLIVFEGIRVIGWK